VLQKSSSTLKAIRSKKTFGISLLNDQQSAVSKHFSSLEKSFSDEKFVWDLQNENFPIIPKSMGSFHCNLVETYELESTYIVLGKVEKFHTVTSGNPLVYWNRKHLSLKLK
jgi:flavin reductase (DIM6/NTAB) family NADH-FMN oxidoreductase RutF